MPDVAEAESSSFVTIRDSLARRYSARLQKTSYIAVPLGGAVAGWWLSYGPDAGWWPFGIGVVLACAIALLQVGAGLLAARATTLKDQDEAIAATESLRPINALALYLDPILRTAAEAVSGSQADRNQAFDRLTQQLVGSIVFAYNDRPNLRSVLYELIYDATGEPEALQVIAQQSNGTREDARDFTRDDPRGRSALDLVINGKRQRYLYVENLEDEATLPPEWHGTGEQYQTFVSVVVLDESTPYGMITIDAPNVDDITEDDAFQMQLAASVAAVLFAERARRR